MKHIALVLSFGNGIGRHAVCPGTIGRRLHRALTVAGARRMHAVFRLDTHQGKGDAYTS